MIEGRRRGRGIEYRFEDLITSQEEHHGDSLLGARPPSYPSFVADMRNDYHNLDTQLAELQSILFANNPDESADDPVNFAKTMGSCRSVAQSLLEVVKRGKERLQQFPPSTKPERETIGSDNEASGIRKGGNPEQLDPKESASPQIDPRGRPHETDRTMDDGAEQALQSIDNARLRRAHKLNASAPGSMRSNKSDERTRVQGNKVSRETVRNAYPYKPSHQEPPDQTED